MVKDKKRYVHSSYPVRCFCFSVYFVNMLTGMSGFCYMSVCVEVYVNPNGGIPAIKLGTCSFYRVMHVIVVIDLVYIHHAQNKEKL